MNTGNWKLETGNSTDLEQRLEHTDLSSRSQVRASLRRDLLDRDHTRRPRAAWMLNAMALGIMALAVIVMGAVITSGSVNPAARSTDEPEQATDVPPITEMYLTPTIVPFVHTVQEGETLLMIVQMYGWEDGSIIPEVIALNGLASEAEIAIGQTLLIPVRVEYPPFDPCNPTPAPTSTIIYDPSLPTATPFIFVITATPISDLVEPTATPMGAPAESTPIDSTWMPTVPPCIPSEGEFGPYDVITATPIPFDPNAPTVPPDDQMPTPTPMDWDATSVPTVPPAVEPTTTVRPQPQPTTATP